MNSRKQTNAVSRSQFLGPLVLAGHSAGGVVSRTALVGIGAPGWQTPVLCVELLGKPGRHRRERIRIDLLQLGRNNPATSMIKQVLFHKSFPVDIRHNAKIGREKLAVWAAEKLS